MTRKRFVKILMARGNTRDGANRYARNCRLVGWSYADFMKWTGGV